jgi:phage terminase Nu1 subunit (DNA packaging protein)
MDIHNLNQRTAAELIGVTARTLRDWTDAPRNADNSYDGTALVRWLVRREAGVELDPVRERARKDKELADKYALENEVRRGTLRRVEEVADLWTRHILSARARLLRLPNDIAAAVEQKYRAVVHAIAKEAVYEALDDLAKSKVGE